MISPASRRRIIIVATTLATLLGADMVARSMRPTLARYNVADYQRKPSGIRKGPMPPIVLMGSSRAKYALVPEEFERATGRRAYNLGIAGSKVVEWLELARALFRADRPELVVIGINASEVRLDYAPAEAARNLFDLADLLESIRLDGLSRDVLGAYLRRAAAPICALFDQRYEIRMWAQERMAWLFPKHAQQARELRDRVEKPEPPDGYQHPWAQGRQLRSVEERLLGNVAGVEAASVPAFDPDAPALNRLAQLLVWLRDRKIEVLVAYIPNCPRTEERWKSVEPRMIEAIARTCAASRVPFITCPRSEVPRTNRDFIEEVHVGLPLARRISQRVAALFLASQGRRPDHDHLVTSDQPLVRAREGASD